MSALTLILIVFGLTAVAFVLARQRSVALVGGPAETRNLHSLPAYYGAYTALCMLLPFFLMLLVWGMSQQSLIERHLVSTLPDHYQAMEPDELSLALSEISNLATGGITGFGEPSEEALASAAEFNRLQQRSRLYRALAGLALVAAGFVFAWRRIRPDFRARNRVEKMVRGLLLACSMVAILTTIGILLSVIFEAIRFFGKVPLSEFLFGLQWSPQTAIRSDQVGSSGSFGAIPLFTGTLLIAGIAMLVATPVGLMTAIYLSEYASSRFR
ncbi:MAG: phosphate ABC transporter permease family protein, partial [Pseudomonadota bacterium]